MFLLISCVLCAIIVTVAYLVPLTVDKDAFKQSDESIKRIDDDNEAAERLIKRMIDYSN